MKQVLQNPGGGTFVRDVPPPPCPPQNVLVRTEFSVISSGTERARVEAGQKSLVGRVRERPELALKAVDRVRRDGLRQTRDLIRQSLEEEGPSGYSSAGTIVEVGAGVRGLSIGDRVACAGAGHANHAEIVSVPGNLCARVPDAVEPEAAALTTIAAIALHGIRLADVRVGDSVAVIGCGLVGQIACRLLVAAGAFVIAVDVDAERVEAAVAGGASEGVQIGDGAVATALSATGGIGVDEALVTAASSSSDPLRLATEVARDRGTVVLVGDVPVDVPRESLYEKELAFRVSRSYGPGRYDREYEERGLDYPIGYVRWTEQRNMACVLDLQARGQLALRDLIDDVIPIDDAEAAYARLSGPPEGRPRGALAFSYPSSETSEDAGIRRGVREFSSAPKPPSHAGTLRIGLIGPGKFATGVLVPAFHRAGVSLAAVTGGGGPSAESLARKSGFERIAATEQDLIADDSIDAVVIATRHDTHAPLVQSCLEAGKHVFCEKPLALDATDLDAVLDAAARANRVLMVGLNRRFSPHLVTVRQFFASSSDRVSGVYRVAAGQLSSSHWLHDLEEGGGRIIGEGCHFVDALAFVAGSRVDTVHASGIAAAGQPVQARDNVMITLNLADGSVATIAYIASGSPELPKERLEVFADTRTAVLDDYRTLELFDGENRKRERLRVQDKGHDAEVRDFVAGVREGRNPIPLEEIANVHRACFAAVESLRTGRVVPIDALASAETEVG